MSALFCLQWYWHGALRTIPRRRSRSRRWLRKPAIDNAQQQENRECDDQKIHDGIQKQAIVQCRCTVSFCISNRWIRRLAEINKQVGKIYVAERAADRGHDDVVHERGNDFTECRADDDTY